MATRFNPHPYVGCDLTPIFCSFAPMVFQSTHPRRVRLLRSLRPVLVRRFQSTHPRRVRLTPYGSMQKISCFNPRTHVGCDLNTVVNNLALLSFNPRTHVGCDVKNLLLLIFILKFQSTHPRRVRQIRSFKSIRLLCFNPRTHVGCDRRCCARALTSRTFQSTHPRRVRHPRTHRTIADEKFQSTHPRRVRLGNGIKGIAKTEVSIHAPT